MARYRQERPKSVGTIVGVVICLGAVGLFLVLLSTGVIKFDKKQKLPPPRAGAGGTAPTSPAPRGRKDPGTTPATSPRPAVAREVRIVFSGSFTRASDTRKILLQCPHCGKDLTEVGGAKCPHCLKALKWPDKVTCGFCKGKGVCTACSGSGECPFCSGGPRMLMGVRPPCDACSNSRKCPACAGTKKCGFCHQGQFYPANVKPPDKKPPTEPPAVPKSTPE
jgi:hypothetical protein